MRQVFWVVLFIFLLPATAHAYVDPGFLGSLYQMAYVLVFGVLAGWVLRPYRYITSMFKKLTGRSKPEEEG